MTAQITDDLLKILVCPKCKTAVVQEDDALQCTNKDCRLRYPIRDGIPIMLMDEAKANPL